MKKQLLKTTALLFLLSLSAKGLSFFAKIFLANHIGPSAMELYTLANGSMMFLITIAQMGIPATLNTVLAKRADTVRVMQNAIAICVITNLLAVCGYLIVLPYLAKQILHRVDVIPVLQAIIPLLPIVTVSGICKGYCLGKQKILLSTASGITEEIARLAFIALMLPMTPPHPSSYAALAMLSIAVGEIGSSLHLLLGLVCQRSLHLSAFFSTCRLSVRCVKDLLSYAIYMTSSRFIGTICSFVEPMLFLYAADPLLQASLTDMYAQIHGYILPIVTLPSFFTIALSNWLLGSYSHDLATRQYRHAKRMLRYVLGLSLMIGIGGSLVCVFGSELLMRFLYHTDAYAPLLRHLALPFALFSLQTPLSTALHAHQKSRCGMIDTACGCLLRLLLVCILPSICGSYALPFAMVAGMLCTTLMHGYHLIVLTADHM